MEGPEVHSHHHGGHSGHRWFDISASVCAIVVSFASLYLAIHHGHVMQEMAEANSRMVTATSWPRVSYSTSNVDAAAQIPQIRLTLTNKGVGPARIEGMELSYDGKPMAGVEALLNACCSAANGEAPQRWMSSANGEILRPGEEKNFLKLNKPADAVQWTRMTELPAKIEVKVCYCSVFDECWVTQSSTHNKAEHVQACPTNWTQYAG